MKHQRSTGKRKGRLSQGRVVFYLEPGLVTKLRAYAEAQDRSVSHVVADAVRALVSGKKGSKP